ncbi:MAG: SRPBCC family protein, partial [Mycolicibacterium frederiksbergense]|nr:SRPBCC family protein [Mycolicibacterium frederiksbergense]
MKISNEFTVSASPDEAWKLLMDLEQVVPLMPGASYLGQDGEDFLGKVKIKVGPVTSEFGGKARFLSRDDTLRRALVSASGKEARGSGNASATITLAVHEAGENNSRVTVDTDMQIVGKLAQFGSSMLQQVSEKLLGQFVDALEAKLAAGKEPAPAAADIVATPAT